MAAELSALRTATRITRPAPLRVKVTGAIRDLIVSGQLARGCHLVETELAAAVGVSRQPVREALQVLSHEGWVDLRPGFGAFVHTPTAQEIDDVFRVRSALEAEAAARAAARVGTGRVAPEQLKALRKVLREGARSIPAGPDAAQVVDFNASLHAAVVELSGNAVLAGMAEGIASRVRWYFSAIATARAPTSWVEHANVVEAIMGGDEFRAGALMREHCERSREKLIELDEPAGHPRLAAPAPPASR